MGLFDRIGRTPEARSIDFTAQGGSGFTGQSLTGLWASSLGRVGKNASSLRPERDAAGVSSAFAARAIDLIVQTASSRPLTVTTDTGEPVDHYLETLFNKSPNPFQSALLFRQTIWTRLVYHGQAFIILDRGNSRVDEPKSAVVHQGKVKVVLTEPTAKFPHGQVLAYKAAVGKNEEVTLAPSEVLWLRFTDPANPWGAQAPLTAALDGIGLSQAAREWQAGQLVNGSSTSGIVYVGNPASDDDYNMAREEIEAALAGPSSAGRIAITGGPIKPEFIKTSATAAEVGFLDTLQAAGEEIALALGVPLDLIGGQRTYNNVEASWRIFWEGTIVPRLAVVASEIDRQLLTNEPLSVLFDTSDVAALQEGRDAVANRVAKAVEIDVVTLDEARAALGFDPMPNGTGAITLSAYRAQITAASSPLMRSVDASETPVSQETRSATPEAAQEAPVVAEDRVAEPTLHVRGVSKAKATRDLDRLEAATQRAVARLADAQRKDAIKRLQRGQRAADLPADASAVFNVAAWVERAYDFLIPSIFAALEAGADATSNGIGKSVNVDTYIAKAAEERAQALAEQVNATTAKVIQDRLAAAAINDRITIDQFIKVLDTTFDDLKGYRAETIARTEMVGSYNSASRAAAVDTGVVQAREWLATGGPNSREEHNALSGYRTLGMEDAYPNGLMFPGDPYGDPAETINCRCVELYVTSYTPEGDA